MWSTLHAGVVAAYCNGGAVDGPSTYNADGWGKVCLQRNSLSVKIELSPVACQSDVDLFGVYLTLTTQLGLILGQTLCEKRPSMDAYQLLRAVEPAACYQNGDLEVKIERSQIEVIVECEAGEYGCRGVERSNRYGKESADDRRAGICE
ncbi:hypothetical protein EV401DRAFT_1882036 [Pisolithus croceorrhizus]|nr:hypothetical protein EV401DRAFT_1882036 [Pisolithus croceorrhizus]